MNTRARRRPVVACLLAASLPAAGCLPIDVPKNYAKVLNKSTETFTVSIAGSNRIASVPPGSGDVLYDRHGPIAETECVGKGSSIVDSAGVVRAAYDHPICPDTIITIAENGTISVRSGGNTLTPVPDPTSTSTS